MPDAYCRPQCSACNIFLSGAPDRYIPKIVREYAELNKVSREKALEWFENEVKHKADITVVQEKMWVAMIEVYKEKLKKLDKYLEQETDPEKLKKHGKKLYLEGLQGRFIRK